MKIEMISDEYLPLRESVFKTLRKAILKGDLKPGERLLEVNLAQVLGVSRTPIREAMRMLEKEGLVVMQSRRGVIVAGITEKNLKDVLEVRKVLEELAIELACDRMTKEEVEKLKEAREEFVMAMKKGDLLQMAGSDEKFHDIIFYGTRNEKLIQILNNFREQMYRYRLEHIKDKKQWELILEEHTLILESIRGKDIGKGKSLIRRHIDNQEVIVLDMIK